MQKDEGDPPAQQPERSYTEEDDLIKKHRANERAIPISPTTIRGNQQYLTKGQDRQRETDDDEYTTMRMDNEEDCAPSRQVSATAESTKTLNRTFLLHNPHSAGSPSLNHHQSDGYHTASGESNTTTTSRPGVVAVPGNSAAQQTNHHSNSSTTNTNTNTTTSITSRESDFPPTTIITATKVAPDQEDVSEAMRTARKEAEQLREQVRTLQQEQRDENQVVVVATAAPMATGAAGEEEDVENKDASKGEIGSTTEPKRNICLWISLLLLAGLVVGGVIALIATSRNDENPTPTSTPTLQPTTESPTLAPTIPCLTTITPADFNETLPLPPLLECQGDCDLDEDCREGLQCFHRNLPFDLVPGCSCWEDDNSRNDYCIEIPSDPCLVQTNDFPLGLCEGECEVNSDCQTGLVCKIRRSEEEEVPGCQFCKQNQTVPDESTLILVTNGTRAESFYRPAAANDTTKPPANDTTQPPANDTTKPPANDTTQPPANDTTKPPANDTTKPPANDTTKPPANDTVPIPTKYCVAAPFFIGGDESDPFADIFESDNTSGSDNSTDIRIPGGGDIANISAGAAGVFTRYYLLCILSVLIGLFVW